MRKRDWKGFWIGCDPGVAIHSPSAHMRTRRVLRHSSLAPYGAKTAYVGGVTDSSQIKIRKRPLQASLEPYGVF